MTAHGVKWSRVVVAKLETGRRPGVNVEELLALAVVLGVSPLTLILPPEQGDGDVQVTPECSAPWELAWRWAVGEQPLLTGNDETPIDDPSVRQFVADNRPFEGNPGIEAQVFLAKRVDKPFKATLTDTSANVSHSIDVEDFRRYGER